LEVANCRIEALSFRAKEDGKNSLSIPIRY
jgi:hypothetical protein